MTYYLMALAALATAYIFGSISFAIPITRLACGKDIRTLGNHNPGASNVMRSVGKGWGLIVITLDVLKGVLPILFFRWIYFNQNSNAHLAILYGIGIVAVLGHCKSIFMKFKGGGGISTMLGVSMFFTPIEFLSAMIVGGLIVIIFFKNADYKFGQKTPIFFVTLTPFFTLLSSLFMNRISLGPINIGGHMPAVVVCSFVMSLMLLAINVIFLQVKIRETDLDEDASAS